MSVGAHRFRRKEFSATSQPALLRQIANWIEEEALVEELVFVSLLLESNNDTTKYIADVCYIPEEY